MYCHTAGRCAACPPQTSRRALGSGAAADDGVIVDSDEVQNEAFASRPSSCSHSHGQVSAGSKRLYANADAFTDVTVGTNAIGHQPGRPGPVGATPYGFNCTAGWDPVTGLGTPRFGELLKRL